MLRLKITKLNFYKNLMNYFIKSAINSISCNKIYLYDLMNFSMLIIILLALLINSKTFFKKISKTFEFIDELCLSQDFYLQSLLNAVITVYMLFKTF